MISNNDNSSRFGKIKRIYLKDFLTYDEVEFFPGENLNVIIGPNGTGKSSIVAAIVIGLGGNCNLLARSSDLHDFVKYGKTEAFIEISLYKTENSIQTFVRKFSNSKNQIYKIDGEKVNQKTFLNTINNYNVQINNLCQFLPQDRVQDFAKMNPQEVLINTQKSVCNQEVTDWFNELIELQKKFKNFDLEFNETTVKLSSLEDSVNQMKHIIENIESRNSLIHQLKVCDMKQAWMEFEKLFIVCKDIQTDLSKAEKALLTHEKKLEPLKTKKNEMKTAQIEYEGIIRNENQNIRKLKNDFNKFDEDIEKHKDEINIKKNQMEMAIENVNKQEAEIKRAEEYLRVLKSDLEQTITSLGDMNKLKDVIKDQKKKEQEIRNHVNRCLAARDTIGEQLERDYDHKMIAMNRRIKNMENVSEIKLKRINQRFSDTYQGILWLRNHKSEFNAPIYETALMELNVKSPDYAKYLENTIGSRDLISFLCEDEDDSSKLMKALREEHGLRQINVAVNSRREIYKPNIPLQDIRKYGFFAYLIDLIEGPLPLLNQLCRLYNIHNIPIGNDYTHEHSDDVPSNFRLFFTTNHRFSVKISKYSKQKSVSVTEIKSHNLLNITIDKKELEQEKQNLDKLKREVSAKKNAQNELENKAAQLNLQIEEINKKINEVEKKFSYLNQMKEKVNIHENKIQRLKSTVINVENEKRTFKEDSRRLITLIQKCHKQQIDVLEVIQSTQHNIKKVKARYSIYQQYNSNIESKIQEVESQINSTKDLVRKIKNEYDFKKEECRKKQEEAKQLTDGETPSNRKFKYKSDFSKLPSTIDELKDYACDLQARVDCLTNNTCDMEDYRNRLDMIEKLKEKVHNFKVNKLKIQTDIQELHVKWYTELERIVNIINTNFSHFLSSMNYAGEIKIINSLNDDYKGYGIEICVKYRTEEKLQTLNRFVQSGGERAVAIAIYTLSLQHISHVPFRCVDEINQGMDRNNERKVFDMLVNETSKQGKSQYFFVTPKLLPNLAYNDLITIHIVHCGSLNNAKFLI